MRLIRFLIVTSCAIALPDAQASALQSEPPFRDAVEANGLLFLSGQIGQAPAGKDPLAGGMDIAANQAMTAVGEVLRLHGQGYDDIVKCTVMLDDIRAWRRFNQVYVKYFPAGTYPARSAFATRGLAYGALVEVECIAKRRE